MLYIGSHVSFKKDTQLLGCVKESISYGANAFMFYTGAPQNTARYAIADGLTIEAYELMKENDIKLENVIVHAPYIVNLSNNNDMSKYEFSMNFLIQELERCEQLGVTKMVLHPGSHVGLGSEIGINNTIKALNKILPTTSVTVLIETMAGKGSEIGKSFEEVKMIIDGVLDKTKIGVCLDTCHIHDAGYDLSDFDQVLDMFDNVIGLDYLKCLHINDSKNIIGASKDRHENIGHGNIGFDTILSIVYNKRLELIPKILETPYIDGVRAPYKEEIEMIRNKRFIDILKV